LKILIVAAHPDDEILGMGGTILKHAQDGCEIKIIYLATGITSRKRYSENKLVQNEDTNSEILSLQNDAIKASKLLGVKKTSFYEFPDNEMDSVPLLKIVKVIEKEIKNHKPDIVYTNHFGDLNIDHRTTFNATLTACRPHNSKIKQILSFEVLSSTEWNYPQKFNPNCFENIETQLKQKIKAMAQFKTEIRKFPHPRSEENISNNAKKWGSVSGQKAAEAFEIIRMIKD